MSTQTLAATPAQSVSTAANEWLQTPLGAYLLAQEQAYIDKTVVDIFGYVAMQFGLPEHDLLRANRMPFRCTIDARGAADLRADFRDLPLISNSVDLALLPHVLEFSGNPHQILREAERVLRPEGHLVITCFNPMSLWGARRMLGSKSAYPWHGHFVNLIRLKDWLALLGFEIAGGAMGGYAPPCTGQKWLERFKFMEAAGDRWWPFGGSVIFLDAVKRVRGMRLIMPKWSERLARGKQLATAPRKDKEQLAASEKAETQ